MTREKAIEAINACFRDTTYTLEEALDNMEALVDLARENVTSLLEDLGNR